MSQFQWIMFGIQMFFTYGPKLWTWFREIVETIQLNKNLTQEQKLAMFRAPARLRWTELRGAKPSEHQLAQAFVRAQQRVNGRGWKPAPEEIRLAGLDRFYALRRRGRA